MKHTNIFIEGSELLLLALSSEVSWIPLEVGTKVISPDEEEFIVTRKKFYIDEDKIEYWVRPWRRNKK